MFDRLVCGISEAARGHAEDATAASDSESETHPASS